MQFSLETRLKDGTPVELVLAGNQDLPLLAKLYDRIVAEGTSYPHERPLPGDEFQDYWVSLNLVLMVLNNPMHASYLNLYKLSIAFYVI